MRTIEREVVGAFIISADQKILLGKSTRKTYEGAWIVPGGGIESGESKHDALARELREELNLDIGGADIEEMAINLKGQSPKLLKETGEIVMGKYIFYNFVLRFKEKSGGIPIRALDDFASATWFDFSDLKKLTLSPPTVTSLEHLGLL